MSQQISRVPSGTAGSRTSTALSEPRGELLHVLKRRTDWMLGFLVLTCALAVFSFVYVCCDWSKNHKHSSSSAAAAAAAAAMLSARHRQQQQQRAVARFSTSGPADPYGALNYHPHGGAVEPQLHDRLSKQQHAATARAAFPRYLYNPDQGHDTFHRPSSSTRAPSQRVHAAQQQDQHRHHPPPLEQQQQQQQQHYQHQDHHQAHHHQEEPQPVTAELPHGGGGGGDEPVSLPPLPSPPGDDASFTLFH